MMLRRKNGRPSSCEPCRIAKLRCDHTRPVCGRCARKRDPNACVYHPAPLTHAKRADTDSSPAESRRDSITTTIHKNTSLAGQWKRYRVAAAVSESSSKVSPASVSSTGLASQAPTGFLGSTSYWADFDENDRPSPRTPMAWSTKASGSAPSPESQNQNLPDHGQVESGAQILALLFEDVPLFETIIKRQLDNSCIWILGWPIMAELFNSIDSLGDNSSLSKSVRTAADLTALSRTLFDNSRCLTQTSQSTTMVEFVEATFARWETIGLLFAAIGTAAATLPKGHNPIQLDESTVVDADKLARVCSDVSEICLGFCNIGVVTDGLCWLLFQQLTLLNHIYGDRGMYT